MALDTSCGMIEGASAPASAKAQQVLAAASRLFMAHGYGATSMDAIAREAGVSKATLYAHFPSKDRLFGAIIGHRCQRFSQALAAQDADPADLRGALLAIGASFLQMILSEQARGIYRIVIAEAPRLPELGRIFFESGPAIVTRRLADFLQHANERGQTAVPDPWLAAKQLIGALQGPFHMARLVGLIDQPDEAELERATTTAVDVFLAAYATDGAAARANLRQAAAGQA